MALTLKQLADELGLSFTGDPDIEIKNLASLRAAVPGDLSFLVNPNDRKSVEQSNCSTVIVPTGYDIICLEKGFIFSPNPQLSFTHTIELMKPEKKPRVDPGIHASAIIADTAVLGDGVSIGALAVIGDHVVIGAQCRIGAGSIIEENARLGNRCYLHSHVTVKQDVEIGSRCIFHPGAVIGADGFGLVENEGNWVKVPQIGTVIIEDDVEIGANTTVDRGALDDTVIEQGCKLDNLIQVAHNVRIGAHTAIAACVGIAGSAIIGAHCKIGGAAVILGHLQVSDNVMITAMSVVTKDIKRPGIYSSGTPLMENSEWHKANVRYKSLDAIARKVNKLNKRFD